VCVYNIHLAQRLLEGRFLIPPPMYLFHPLEGKKSSVNVNRTLLVGTQIYTKKKFDLHLPNSFEVKTIYGGWEKFPFRQAKYKSWFLLWAIELILLNWKIMIYLKIFFTMSDKTKLFKYYSQTNMPKNFKL
jgi:hypothetical protein